MEIPWIPRTKRPWSVARLSNKHRPSRETEAISGEGGDLLTYAVRSGGGHTFLLALGAACLIGGAWAMYWLLSEGESTIAGAIFLVLVPGGVMLFGVYSLNIALWLRHEYLLSRHALMARTYSLFGDKRMEIPRQAITAIRQSYTPPKSSSATGTKGDWVVFVAYRKRRKAVNWMSFRWMANTAMKKHAGSGRCCPEWAGVPLHRGLRPGSTRPIRKNCRNPEAGIRFIENDCTAGATARPCHWEWRRMLKLKFSHSMSI